MTREEIITAVIKGLRAQGRLANEDGCHYIRNGLKCAVGQLLPDDIAERWESYDDDSFSLCLAINRDATGLTSRQLDEVERDLHNLGLWDERELLYDLQDLHDKAKSLDKFVRKAARL